MTEQSQDNPKRTRRLRNHPFFLTISLFVLLLAHPFFADLRRGELILNGLFTLVLLSAAVSLWSGGKSLAVICLLGLPWVVISWLTDFMDSPPVALEIAGLALLTAFNISICVMLLANILTTTKVSLHTLSRAVSAYLLLGVAWAGIYGLLQILEPGSLRVPEGSQWGSHVYFSFVTLTTLGYGDVTPVTEVARSVVMIEAIVGPMYLAMIIARLVALYTRGQIEALDSAKDKRD